MDWQIAVAGGAVAASAAYLVWSVWRAWSGRRSGCGGCGCSTKQASRPEGVTVIPTEQLTIRRRQES